MSTSTNHAKRRRQAKALAKVRGNAGTPNPADNREWRRSPQAKAEREQMLLKLAATLRP